MSLTLKSNTVDQIFFQPLTGLVAQSYHTVKCPEFSDELFVHLGVQRMIESSPSGRGFLQEHGLRFENAPGHSNYFAALNSPRRLEVVRDVSLALVASANLILNDRLEGIPELALYDCFAVDGHWHQAAAHDPRHEGTKMAVGHFYSLNLRTHTLRHLATGQGLHEHDMSALKRVKPRGLRQGVKKGRRVLLIHDKAGIDFVYWKRCRHECAVYFLSRAKEGMVYDWIESVDWNRSDARNRGVTEDKRVKTSDGHLMRIVFYTDPQTGTSYEFLTNEMDLTPGIIAELYRKRWEVEKVFDEIKNKLGQTKAWATSLEAKETQAHLVGITHNLLMLYEQSLETRHGIKNAAEEERREGRMEKAEKKCRKSGSPIPTLVLHARGATQRSVKFIRWIKQSIRDHIAETTAVLRLRDLYAAL